jgi:hypothetical protein
MRAGFFLIPTWSMARNGRPTIPLDYRAEIRDVDKRTRFLKNYGKWETSAFVAVSAAERLGLRVFREDGRVTRILAPDAKTARAYFAYMKNHFGTI